MIKFLTTSILLLTSIIGFTQELNAPVKGKIVDQNSQPISEASVYLVDKDSTAQVLKATISNRLGEFELAGQQVSSFKILVKALGYSDYTTSLITPEGGQTYAFQRIVLLKKQEEIAEVLVERTLPRIHQKQGKIIMEVENSSLDVGNNAFEVLKRAPGVSVDHEEKLYLMGSSGVKVMIDGRPTFMNEEQTKEYLKTLDASQIKSIEVSTTRQAKDDAEGGSRVINIVLKRSRLEGFSGSVNAGLGKGRYYNGNSSASLNYKRNGTTFFGSYAYRNDKRLANLDIIREIQGQEDASTLFDQNSDLGTHSKSHNFRVGIEQKTSDRNTVMLEVSGNHKNDRINTISTTLIGPKQGVVDSLLLSDTKYLERFNRYSAHLNDEWKVDTLGQKLVFDMEYSSFRTKNDADYFYELENHLTSEPTKSTEMQQSSMPSDIDIFVSQIDYEKPLWRGTLETGIKYSHVNSDNDLKFLEQIGQEWQDMENRTNHFIYKEQIAAAYVDYGFQVDKWSLKAGLRMEQTWSDGHSINLDKRNKREYLDYFPSASLGYTLNPNHLFTLNFSKGIRRPNYSSLNPFDYFIDKFTFQRGNPDLAPQYETSYSLNYSLFSMFNINMGVENLSNAIVESMGQDRENNTTWIISENLARGRTSHINISAPVQITKWWSVFNNLTGAYLEFNGPIANENIDVNSFMFSGNSMNNFKVSPTLSAEVSLQYQSPFIYNVYKLNDWWRTDVALSKKLLNNQATLKLAVQDVFKTQKIQVESLLEKQYSHINQYYDTRKVQISFSYNFGKLQDTFKKRAKESRESERAL